MSAEWNYCIGANKTGILDIMHVHFSYCACFTHEKWSMQLHCSRFTAHTCNFTCVEKLLHSWSPWCFMNIRQIGRIEALCPQQIRPLDKWSGWYYNGCHFVAWQHFWLYLQTYPLATTSTISFTSSKATFFVRNVQEIRQHYHSAKKRRRKARISLQNNRNLSRISQCWKMWK